MVSGQQKTAQDLLSATISRPMPHSMRYLERPIFGFSCHDRGLEISYTKYYFNYIIDITDITLSREIIDIKLKNL